jgi:hypothetical protein
VEPVIVNVREPVAGFADAAHRILAELVAGGAALGDRRYDKVFCMLDLRATA